MNSGIYIVQLLNDAPMPVTRDPRYVKQCAEVNKLNIKVGKARNFDIRRSNYWKDFDVHNVIFEKIAVLEDIKTAEKVILRALKKYRKLSLKGGKLEWLEGITYEEAKSIALNTLKAENIRCHIPTESLYLDLIPKQDASVMEIMIFGSSFDGYIYWGSSEECAKVANEQRQATITDLRTCLFFELRRWRHFGKTPDEKALIYWRGIVRKIREKYVAGERKG